MPGPLQAAGAVSEPSEYAPLSMDRYITGLWTQRNPLRDADVPYLQAKFYGATRFDSIIDGLNMEITSKLTTARRPGNSIYNSATWPAVKSFYPFKWLLGGGVGGPVEHLQVMVDTATAVYDGTGPSTKNLIWTKSSAAGKTRFVGVGNALYFGDGVDAQKYLQPTKSWFPNTSFNIGDLIVDTNGNLQEVTAVAVTAPIVSVQVLAIGGVTFARIFLGASNPFAVGVGPGLGAVTFSGLTTATFLNGVTLHNVLSYATTAIQASDTLSHAAYGPATDTGTVSGSAYENASGLSRPTTPPIWATSLGAQTTDEALTWTCVALAAARTFNWGVASPTVAPTVTPYAPFADQYWQPNTVFAQYTSVLDNAGNVQMVLTVPGPGTTSGPIQPIWNTIPGGFTFDGALLWINLSRPGTWLANTDFMDYQSVLDVNGNIQYVGAITSAGETGSVAPTWMTTPGALTVDNDVTWVCAGPGIQLATATFGYAYSYHALDASNSNASSITYVPNGILGTAGNFGINLTGPGPSDPQDDQIWIYRLSQGGSILLLLDQIPAPAPGVGGGTWSYIDTLPDTDLDAFSEAPINDENDPPPLGITAPTYHLGRIWGIVGSTLYYSTGPDTNGSSNGNTAWSPGNNFPFPEILTRTDSITSTNGPALVVWSNTNVYLITGLGTASSPFASSLFMPRVGLLSYDEVCVVGSTFYLLANTRKGVSLDPGAGYQEVGFPIGDQFVKVTTGGINSALYNPGTGYVTWHEKNSGDSGVFYADGAVGWFRYSPVASPESGFLWSPRAAIAGGTSAVQSVETSPGTWNLLVGPASSGPILMRDTSTNADDTVAYANTYMTVGNIQLCESGEIAEIAHIQLDSVAVGTAPTCGVLIGEIAATAAVPFDMLAKTSPDPPDLPEAQTLFNDRFTLLQNGVCPKCRHFQLLIQYVSENAASELLGHTIYGAKHAERKQQ